MIFYTFPSPFTTTAATILLPPEKAQNPASSIAAAPATIQQWMLVE